MNVFLFILLGLSVGVNFALYKTAKQLKARVFEVEKNDRSNNSGDN